MRSSAFAFAAVLIPLALACTKQSPDPAPPHLLDDAPPPHPSLATSASAPPASAIASAPAPPASAPAPAIAPASPPPDLHVRLATIGIHVGGGPYDEITKEPIKRSVEPHFPELTRCWAHVAKQQPTDVGVDLVIETAGGHAHVSNPRTSATGEGFVACVVAFFESVDFQKPRNGKTVVSYSVRFTP